MKAKYPTQIEVQEVFELVDGELWRKEHVNGLSQKYPRKKIVNKANTTLGYCQVRFKRRVITYHTVVWLLIHGNIPDNLFIDHIDGNKLNNNINNLRLVTQRENCQNRSVHRNGKLFGCGFFRKMGKWRARARVNGCNICIGYYNTEQEAHEAYKNYLKEQVDGIFT